MTNSRDVTVRLVNVTDATMMRYCALNDASRDCRPEEFSSYAAISTEFSVAFTSDGTKKVCVQLSDDVGNMSPTNICDTITIDTDVPDPPELPRSTLSNTNASCAYIEAERTDLSDFDRFEYRALGGQWRPVIGADDQDQMMFDPADPSSTAHIKFALEQDSTNLLQIRVVDAAGNPSVPMTAIVDEVSSSHANQPGDQTNL